MIGGEVASKMSFRAGKVDIKLINFKGNALDAFRINCILMIGPLEICASIAISQPPFQG